MLDDVWRPRAEWDLQSILIYLGVERKNPKAASAAGESIMSAVEMIRQSPDIGGYIYFGELNREYRTMLANPYIIYYTFNKKSLTVHRVLHQRQDIDTYALVDLEEQ